MKLFSSINSRPKDFKPINEGKVGIYSCGPTVYNLLHIGNLSAFIYADTLRRAFKANGYTVKHVMNITDVDDKTIRDSKRDYPDKEPHDALKSLTEKYTKIFKDDLQETGNNNGDIEFISAVETIPEMIALTQKLLDNSIAYIAEDGVYFSIRAHKAVGHKYGLLQKVELAKTQSRIANDEYDKDSASDFALWKKAVDGEPSWPAEFNNKGNDIKMAGRPGWHIECSAMSEKLLGVPFDVHTGGIDLKFPHHENEIAQTRAASNTKLTNYFVHNNHILVDGKKMSKSLNNFYTLQDIKNKNFTPQAFRLLVLESHYRKENNFSWEILTAAQNRLSNWMAKSDRRWQLPENNDTGIINKLANALANDMNTPKALVYIDSYFDEIEQTNEAPNKDVMNAIKDYLGIDLFQDDISGEIKTLIKERQEARDKQQWSESDAIREKLHELGITVKDSSKGQIWSRI